LNRQQKARAVVLVSGNGSNLQAFIDAVAASELDLDLAAVISNRADAYGLQRARDAGIEDVCVPSRGVADRDMYDRQLAGTIERYSAQLVILAGFMRILGKPIVERFAGRMLNIHPSLLPKFPGLDTHARALAAGEREHGCTVHFVTEELDGGPPIIQARVAVAADDDADSLARRVLALEHKVYPRAAALFVAGRVRCVDQHCYLDGHRLAAPLQFES